MKRAPEGVACLPFRESIDGHTAGCRTADDERTGGALRNVLRALSLAVLLNCAVGEAVADWTFLVAADDADWYFDEALGRKRGTMAKVWTLQQYRSAQPLQSGGYWSSKTQAEIRCDSRQWRVFYFSSYSGSMGEGEQLYAQEAAGAWRSVSPGTVSEALYKAGCHPGEN